MSDTVRVSRAALRTVAGLSFPIDKAGALVDIVEALNTPVPWHRARALVADLRFEIAQHGPVATAGADQVQAYATSRLAELEVDVTDPAVLYEVLVVLALVRECARNGWDNGVIDYETEQQIASVCRALAAGLVVLAPDEARS